LPDRLVVAHRVELNDPASERPIKQTRRAPTMPEIAHQTSPTIRAHGLRVIAAAAHPAFTPGMGLQPRQFRSATTDHHRARERDPGGRNSYPPILDAREEL
jgi:hypothetical protein